MQNTFSQSGNDSKWFLKKSFFKIGKWHSRPPRDPPPFMANAILNFHFDFLKPSLIHNLYVILIRPWLLERNAIPRNVTWLASVLSQLNPGSRSCCAESLIHPRARIMLFPAHVTITWSMTPQICDVGIWISISHWVSWSSGLWMLLPTFDH